MSCILGVRLCLPSLLPSYCFWRKNGEKGPHMVSNSWRNWSWGWIQKHRQNTDAWKSIICNCTACCVSLWDSAHAVRRILRLNLAVINRRIFCRCWTVDNTADKLLNKLLVWQQFQKSIEVLEWCFFDVNYCKIMYFCDNDFQFAGLLQKKQYKGGE